MKVGGDYQLLSKLSMQYNVHTAPQNTCGHT